MRVIADLHIHGRYSRATSQRMRIDEIARFAEVKGLSIVGTGDFTHPKWLKELGEELVQEPDSNLYKTAKNSESPVHFMITTEVSTVFTFKGDVKKVHHVILTPSIETAVQINDRLSKYGDLTVDGRPTLNMGAPHLVEEIMEVSAENMVFPAHCVPPGTYVYTRDGVKKIEEVNVGDYVFTHKGRTRRVLKTFKRRFKGKLVRIVPRYFEEGFLLTPEHPVYAIKTYKNCRWKKGICKPSCSVRHECKHKFFERYKAEWVQAKDLKVGDVLVYPRIRKVTKIMEIPFTSALTVSDGLCRLIGYYLADGCISRDGLRFSFNKNEGQYIEDVTTLMREIFGLFPKVDSRRGIDLIYYSKGLAKFFKEQCYLPNFEKRAWSKCAPSWALLLPRGKLLELLKGWWRGDRGATSSKALAYQMLFVCLQLGVIPSITCQKEHMVNMKNLRIDGRRLRAKHDHYYFRWLSPLTRNAGKKLNDGCFSKSVIRSKCHYGWADKSHFYLPIRVVETMDYDGFVYNLEVEEDNSYLTAILALHNCWTPWFSIFGAFSGFDSVEDCYQDMTKHVYALETGLSSDPQMNWRLSKLDGFTLVSNSDGHSFWPWRIGREANVFELKELSYREVVEAIRSKDRRRFKFTIETDPAYGKYHWTGHRNCGVSLPPQEAIKLGNICPVCRKKLTKGVEQRVEELADRPAGFAPEGAIGFMRLLPLSEIISAVLGVEPSSQRVWNIYNDFVKRFGDEYTVLIDASEEALKGVVYGRIAEAIIRVREGKVKVVPGYDGVYGKMTIFEEEPAGKAPERKRQLSLTDFM